MPQAGFDLFYEDLTSFLRDDVARIAGELWSRRAAQPDAMKAARKARTDGYRRLLKVLASYQELTQSPDASGPGEVKKEILIRLGLWFCSYFLGFPLPHVWERVRHLESVSEGYIGSGALYDKLAGDIYRGERKTRDRHRRHSGTVEPGPREPVLVLAFSPTLLIADEELKGQLPESQPSPYDSYVSELEKLAGRYLRLQMWLYLESEGPIVYAFQFESTAAALARQAGESADVETVRGAVEARFRQMAGDSRNTQLYGIPECLFEGEVFTSCTLGPSDGVIADRAQHEAGSAKRSTWVKSQYLTLEREKVFNLLYGPKKSRTDPPSVQMGICSGERALDELLRQWETLAGRRRGADDASRAAFSTEVEEVGEGGSL